MHVIFNPQNLDWTSMINQSSYIENGIQWGSNSYFTGTQFQRGGGIGSVLKSFFRFLLPMGKEVGSALAKQGLESSSRVLSQMVSDGNSNSLQESLTLEGKRGLKKLLNKAADNINPNTTHFYKQSGDGLGKIKKTIKKNQSPKILRTYINPVQNKSKKRLDSLGYY